MLPGPLPGPRAGPSRARARARRSPTTTKTRRTRPPPPAARPRPRPRRAAGCPVRCTRRSEPATSQRRARCCSREAAPTSATPTASQLSWWQRRWAARRAPARAPGVVSAPCSAPGDGGGAGLRARAPVRMGPRAGSARRGAAQDLVAALLDAGADAAMVEAQGLSALHVAAVGADPAGAYAEVVSLLLAKDKETGAGLLRRTTAYGDTVLLFMAGAAAPGALPEPQARVLRQLLGAGADRAALNAQGLTAEALARLRGAVGLAEGQAGRRRRRPCHPSRSRSASRRVRASRAPCTRVISTCSTRRRRRDPRPRPPSLTAAPSITAAPSTSLEPLHPWPPAAGRSSSFAGVFVRERAADTGAGAAGAGVGGGVLRGGAVAQRQAQHRSRRLRPHPPGPAPLRQPPHLVPPRPAAARGMRRQPGMAGVGSRGEVGAPPRPSLKFDSAAPCSITCFSC